MTLRRDAHDREDAGGQGGGHQIGGGEGLAAALVVERRIGEELGSGGIVNRLAAQLAFVAAGHGGHGAHGGRSPC